MVFPFRCVDQTIAIEKRVFTAKKEDEKAKPSSTRLRVEEGSWSARLAKETSRDLGGGGANSSSYPARAGYSV